MTAAAPPDAKAAKRKQKNRKVTLRKRQVRRKLAQARRKAAKAASAAAAAAAATADGETDATTTPPAHSAKKETAPAAVDVEMIESGPTAPVQKAPSRAFAVDLDDYLRRWEQRSQGDWKFNKVLQAWAVTHCLDRSQIASPLFKRLLPYFSGLHGHARDRVVAAAQDVLRRDGEEAAGMKIQRIRAKKLLGLFHTTTTQD